MRQKEKCNRNAIAEAASKQNKTEQEVKSIITNAKKAFLKEKIWLDLIQCIKVKKYDHKIDQLYCF